MLRNIKDFILQEGKNVIDEQKEAKIFHTRIQNEIELNKKKMKQQRQSLRFIRNK